MPGWIKDAQEMRDWAVKQLTLDDALIAAQVDDEEVIAAMARRINETEKRLVIPGEKPRYPDIDLDAILPEFEDSDLDFTGMECAD